MIQREPDFQNLADVLERKVPGRPTLFEFFMNKRIYRQYAQEYYTELDNDVHPAPETLVMAFKNLGYDYATMKGSDLRIVPFRKKERSTISLNGQAYITNRLSFEQYNWPDPEQFDYSRLTRVVPLMGSKMRLVVFSQGGVLENTIALTGYENLCMMLYDDPQLVEDLFEKVGSILLEYYKICCQYSSVGAIIVNDDWGFNTQTMLRVKDMRRLVFPWHKNIVTVAHASGKYAILHSCGNYSAIINDVIDDMKYDARHSYEDNIIPVEEAYEALHHRIAVLGGLDLDFMVRSSPDIIYARAKKLVGCGMQKGGYALGTGNSIPEYLPDENYHAMRKAVLEDWM